MMLGEILNADVLRLEMQVIDESARIGAERTRGGGIAITLASELWSVENMSRLPF